MITAPPSTINNLDAEQRSCLLRSTRKLGAVLGATPIHLDLPIPSTQKPPKHNGPHPLAQPVILSLRSVPAKKSRHSPTSASFPNSSAQNDRRRKMAKLTRTLGENIPPELVFGSPPKRSASVKPRTQKQTGSLSAAIHADQPIVLSPVPESKKRVGRPRSLTLGSLPTPKDHSARGTASLDSPRQASFAVQRQEWGLRGNGVRRKEKGWSGEWNVQDMGDVVKALRQLR